LSKPKRKDRAIGLDIDRFKGDQQVTPIGFPPLS